MQFQCKIRLLPGGDRGFEPLFQSMVFGRKLWVRRLVPVSIEVFAAKIKPRAAESDAILVRHRQDPNAVTLQEVRRFRIVAKQAPNEALRHPIASGFPGMSARPEEN